MARPLKFNDEVKKAIVDALAIGATRKDAALAAGVAYNTFLRWMQRGQDNKSGMFREFYESASVAEGEARLKFTTTIAQAAAKGDWRAAMEYLSRRDRDNWSKRTEVTGADGGPIEERHTLSWGDPEQPEDEGDG